MVPHLDLLAVNPAPAPAIAPFLAGAAGLGLLTVAAVALMKWQCRKRALFDLPNDRSSHTLPTPRLGGAAFVPVLLAGLAAGWLLLGRWNLLAAAMLVGAAVLYVVGLIDDLRPLSARLRMAIHIAVGGALLAAAWRLSGRDDAGAIAGLAALVCLGAIVGTINIYNFMDGIDGIAGIQAFVGGVAWAVFAWQEGAAGAAWGGLAIAAVAAGFLLHNWSPASIFMGDAGSTVLGFLLVALPFSVWIETGERVPLANLFVAALLVLWPFLLDGVGTILRRARAGENIFAAHRSHLYQRLSRARRSHSTVSALYGILAVYGAVVAWWALRGVSAASLAGLAGVMILYGALRRHTAAAEARARSATEGKAP